MAVDKGSVNRVTLIGRLGTDPELKHTPNGAAMAHFNMATNRSWKDSEGNAVEKTDWHRIVVWRKPAEIIAEYCKKGHRLYIDGRLETRSWDDNNGQKRFMTEVVVENFTFLESRSSNGGGGNTGFSAPPIPEEPPAGAENNMAGDAGDDDLPF